MLCKIKKILPWVAVFIWMLFIFYMSHQSAVDSAEVSEGFLDKILAVFGNIINHNTLRKMAHAFEYFILCILIFNALHNTLTKNKVKVSVLSISFSLGYAISDEVHQLFIPGRAGMVSDVGIDMAGAAAGLIFCLMLLLVYSKIKSENK